MPSEIRKNAFSALDKTGKEHVLRVSSQADRLLFTKGKTKSLETFAKKGQEDKFKAELSVINANSKALTSPGNNPVTPLKVAGYHYVHHIITGNVAMAPVQNQVASADKLEVTKNVEHAKFVARWLEDMPIEISCPVNADRRGAAATI